MPGELLRSWPADDLSRTSSADEHEISRREFVRLTSLALAMAQLAGCARNPRQPVVPYVQQPEQVVPGEPLMFATALTQRGYALGVLVESHTGRPTKIEGNPDHPASGGATDIFAQAAAYTLYDPDRSQSPTMRGAPSAWGEVEKWITDRRESWSAAHGRRLRIMTGPTTSPTLHAQMQRLLKQIPGARWDMYDPLGEVKPFTHEFEHAQVIVALDADFLGESPGNVAAARSFMQSRKPAATMNRLYVAEACPSVTGAMADHRLAIRSREIGAVAAALAGGAAEGLSESAKRWVRAAVEDLKRVGRSSVVLVGPGQPAEVHVAVRRLNERLGNAAAKAPSPGRSPGEQLAELVAEMRRGEVGTLVMIGVNPVYDAPADLEFASALQHVEHTLHAGLFADETAERCAVHVPLSHELESWSDAASVDGAVSVIQPLIEPLYDSRGVHEMISMLQGESGREGYDIVRDFWRSRWGKAFEDRWFAALSKGVIEGEYVQPAAGVQPPAAKTALPHPGVEINFRADATIGDGAWANNAWLQELPKPMTKLTWDNAVLMGPATAERIGVTTGQVVRLELGGRRVDGPVFILPGHAEEAVTVTVGYGRWRSGRVGDGRGFNAYALRRSGAEHFDGGLVITPTERRVELATTQTHQQMDDREPVKRCTVGKMVVASERPDIRLNLYPERGYEGVQWGMVIDLTACIGCGACTIACQAENNIAVVGKAEVLRGREMHWIRVDRYYERRVSGGVGIYHQPVPCMHCENAPCELVCPVGATQHSEDGLNEMVYNRCVGTRYCSNNCPYKVRRFNFFNYVDEREPLKLQRNPDVSVRGRGVMEKCTYCVQRIRRAEIERRVSGAELRDGDVVTACQQVCPTRAIVFGDLNDANSAVAKLRRDARHYALLGELNTKPRTTYLARVANPSPQLEETG